MSENRNYEDSGNLEYVSVDKRADILQSTFLHYFSMAMDHHTKAATTSNILLIFVGASVGLVSLDNLIGGVVDFGAGLAMTIIGIFGAVWSFKQHERYYYWQHIAYEYQKELIKIMPGLETAEESGAYDRRAKAASAEKFTPLFAERIHDRYLWVSLHGLVVVMGVVLMVVSVL